MLSESLKKLLANSYAFVIKAQQFHWNVEGPNFPQYHEFFGDLYGEVYASIDKTAEYIRTLDSYTPGSFARLSELCAIPDQLKIPRAELMFAELAQDNQKLLDMWKQAFHLAEQEDQQGICDFIASRIDAHAKHGWMLKSTLKKDRA